MEQSLLDCMKQMLALLNQLDSVVKQRDGERIVEVIDEYRAISLRLQQTPLEKDEMAAIDECRQLSEDINRIQNEILVAAAPWMDDIRILLRENRTGQAVNAAYRPGT